MTDATSITVEDGDSSGLAPPPKSQLEGLRDIAVSFAPLGFIAFGGPVAHVALLETVFVEKKRYISEQTFMELYALAHALPGPSSTQMVVAVAAMRAGIPGAILAFVLWSIPALVVLIAAGVGVERFDLVGAWWLAGLPPAGAALVYPAAYKIGTKCCVDRLNKGLALTSALVVVLATTDSRIETKSGFLFPILIALGGLVRMLFQPTAKPKTAATDESQSEVEKDKKDPPAGDVHLSKLGGCIIILIWAAGFAALTTYRFSIDTSFPEDKNLLLAETFYRIGSVIFGGGQVVLPMLVEQIVSPGWMDKTTFYEGMALTQACPGPLFNFSAYLGAVIAGVPGALISCAALFFPGCSLILAVHPFWLAVRKRPAVTKALSGINAAATGLVFAAVMILSVHTVKNGADAAVVLVTASLSAGFKVPAPLAVIAGGVLGASAAGLKYSLAEL